MVHLEKSWAYVAAGELSDTYSRPAEAEYSDSDSASAKLSLQSLLKGSLSIIILSDTCEDDEVHAEQ